MQKFVLIHVFWVILLPGCSKRAVYQAATPSSESVRSTVLPDAALPAAPVAPPVAPAPSVASAGNDSSACTLMPPGGMVLIKKRSLPSVAVGRSGVIVTHRSPNRSHAVTGPHELIQKARKAGDFDDGTDCTWHDGYIAVALPLEDAAPQVLYDPAADKECAEVSDNPLPANLGGEAVLTNCYNHGTSAGYGHWACSIERPFTEGSGTILSVGTTGDNHLHSGSESGTAWDISSRDGVLFMAAILNGSRLYGVVIQPDGKARERVVETLGGDDSDRSDRKQVSIQPLSAKEAVVTVTPGDPPESQTPVLQFTMNDKARRVGPIRHPPAAPPPSSNPAVQVEVAPRSASIPPHVIMRRGGKVQLVSGLGDQATFSPVLIELNGEKFLVWSAGLGKSTRIRAARFDVNRAAVVGPVSSVSADGHEAGFVSGGAFGGRAVVAWEQEQNATWEIRIAELTCPRGTLTEAPTTPASSKPVKTEQTPPSGR